MGRVFFIRGFFSEGDIFHEEGTFLRGEISYEGGIFYKGRFFSEGGFFHEDNSVKFSFPPSNSLLDSYFIFATCCKSTLSIFL